MVSKKKEYVLIASGGQGRRMAQTLPKQFIPLCGKPLLFHTIEAFFHYSNDIIVVLVLPKEHIKTWKELCNQFHFNRPVQLEAGGTTRFLSVKNGLNKIQGEGCVAIHDGVRPLVSTEIIASSFRLATRLHTAVTTIPLTSSLCSVKKGVTIQEDRTQYRLVQTPQTFDISLIKQAYASATDVNAPDDASIVAQAGHTIHLCQGSDTNIKVTTSEDLIATEALLKCIPEKNLLS